MLFVPTSVYYYNFILINRTRESCLVLLNYNSAAEGNSISVCLLKCFLPELESRTQGLRPRTQKKSEAKTNYRLSEDRPSRGQGQEYLRPRTKGTTRKCSPRKKRSSRRKLQIFRETSVEEKNVHNLGSFLTNQKIVLSSAEDRLFSRTWRL